MQIFVQTKINLFYIGVIFFIPLTTTLNNYFYCLLSLSFIKGSCLFFFFYLIVLSVLNDFVLSVWCLESAQINKDTYKLAHFSHFCAYL